MTQEALMRDVVKHIPHQWQHAYARFFEIQAQVVEKVWLQHQELEAER